MLRDSGASLVLLDPDRLSRLTAVLADCPAEHIFVSAGAASAGAKATRLEDILGAPGAWRDLPDEAAPPPAEIALDDDATILYTSGTSGRPRGVLLTHRNLVSQVFQASLIQLRCALCAGLAPPNPDPLIGPQRVNLVAIPLFHVSGVSGCILPLMGRGGKAVFMRHWIPSRALKLIQDERVTVTGGVPVVAAQLLEQSARDNYDLSSLEQVIYGGAPSPGSLAHGLAGRLDAQPGNAWGMTETHGGFISHVGPESTCGGHRAAGAVRRRRGQGGR